MKISKEILKIAVMGGLLIVVQAFAFTEPSVAPPGNNVSAPLNVGNLSQTKIGGLILNWGTDGATGGAANGLAVAQGNVGIGTVNPTAKLDVQGKVKIADGTQGANKVLTSDANGLASWKPTHGLAGICYLTPNPPDTICSGPGPGGSAVSPAFCSVDACNCEAGYLLVQTGFKGSFNEGQGSKDVFSCLQN